MSLKAITNFSMKTKIDSKRRTIMVSSMEKEINDNFSLLPTELNQKIYDYMDIFDFVSFLSSHRTQMNNKELLLKEKLKLQLNSRTIFERAHFFERYFNRFKMKITFSDTEIEIEEQIKVDQDYPGLKNVFELNYKEHFFKIHFYDSVGSYLLDKKVDKIRILRINSHSNYNLPIDYPRQMIIHIKRKNQKNEIFTSFSNYDKGIDPFDVENNQNFKVSFVFA